MPCPKCSQPCKSVGSVLGTELYGCDSCIVQKPILGSGQVYEMTLIFAMRMGVAIDPVTEEPIRK